MDQGIKNKTVEIKIIAFQMAIEICKKEGQDNVFEVYNKIKTELVNEN